MNEISFSSKQIKISLAWSGSIKVKYNQLVIKSIFFYLILSCIIYLLLWHWFIYLYCSFRYFLGYLKWFCFFVISSVGRKGYNCLIFSYPMWVSEILKVWFPPAEGIIKILIYLVISLTRRKRKKKINKQRKRGRKQGGRFCVWYQEFHRDIFNLELEGYFWRR